MWPMDFPPSGVFSSFRGAFNKESVTFPQLNSAKSSVSTSWVRPTVSRYRITSYNVCYTKLLRNLGGDLAGGYYVQPTVLKGHNKMRVFQEEIFGPVVSVTTFKDEAEALSIANDTLYGLGAGVWSREANTCYRFGRGIQAGRVWTNCYHAYPAHAAFGGYKQSGIGRENHRNNFV